MPLDPYIPIPEGAFNDAIPPISIIALIMIYIFSVVDADLPWFLVIRLGFKYCKLFSEFPNVDDDIEACC